MPLRQGQMARAVRTQERMHAALPSHLLVSCMDSHAANTILASAARWACYVPCWEFLIMKQLWKGAR